MPEHNNNHTDCTNDDVGYCDDIRASSCYQNKERHECCAKCKDYETGHLTPGCEYGDRWENCNVNDGIRCYNNTVKSYCCDTCINYETGVPNCRYGDKIDTCESSSCHLYPQNKRSDCCITCMGPHTPKSTTYRPTTTHKPFAVTSSFPTYPGVSTTYLPSSSSSEGSSASSNLPTWVIPVAASAGGLLFIIFVVIVCVCVRRSRSRAPHHLSPIDEKMYNDYKMSKRAPVAAPRDPSTKMTDKIQINGRERKDSAEYAYINPDDVIVSSQGTSRRSGADPLPQPPPEYVTMTDADKYGYVDFETRGNKDNNNTSEFDQNNYSAKRSNTYHKFPGEMEQSGAETKNVYSEKM